MDSSTERSLRARLGIPSEAQHVLILAESSHWDPDWLLTWEEYFDRYVRANLDSALDELAREPRRVYSIECLFFLQMYWDRRPERQATIREMVNSGRLRLTSSGITTADTLIASTEAILRDWLVGQEWLRSHGMTVEPSLAYFPDSFGASHSLPSLLNAAGFTYTALTRLDGMLFVGCDWPVKSWFQWEGSSAGLLMKHERSLDFVWRDNSGGEVLCHWNAFTYGQGDMLAHSGLVRMYLYPLAIPNRADWNVARHIQGFVRQLRPFSHTPYMFCPIGFDFVAPIPDLVALLDRHNRRHFQDSGAWAVNAGLDDYLALVGCHRSALPILELDPNPYWTGYYSARPSLKKLAHETVSKLQLAEAEAACAREAGAPFAGEAELQTAWQAVVVSNHHDYITGTATDRVTETEQIPWLQRASAAADAILSSTEGMRGRSRREAPAGDLEYTERDGRVVVSTPRWILEFAEAEGGALASVRETSSGVELLGGPSNHLVAYEDSGGLWRMGQEFVGGIFRIVDHSGRRPAKLHVTRLDGCVEVSATAELDGMELTRVIWIRPESRVIRCQVRGRAADRRTVAVRLETGFEATAIAMDEPGGVCYRPVQKKYIPTFWPAQSMVHVVDGVSGRGVALFLGMPGAVTYRPGGALELVTHRNALRETAFGIVHFPGQPATGHDRMFHIADYAIDFTPSGHWLENRLLHQAQDALAYTPGGTSIQERLAEAVASLFRVDGSGVMITAVKPAWRGEGTIVRLLAPEKRGEAVEVRFLGGTVAGAWLCDARERDLEVIPVHDNAVQLLMPGSLATLRMIVRA